MQVLIRIGEDILKQSKYDLNKSVEVSTKASSGVVCDDGEVVLLMELMIKRTVQ